MKKLYRNITFTILAAAISGCADNLDTLDLDTAGGLCHKEFAASAATSKTFIESDGTTVMFSGNEEIAVYNGIDDECYQFANTTGEPSKTASINGEIVPSDSYYALMPMSAAISFSDGYLTAELKSEQAAVNGTVDPSAQIMVAYTDGTSKSLNFKNACSFVRVTTEQAFSRISISSNNGEPIAGEFKVKADDPSDIAPTSGKASISIVSANGMIEPGTYYIAMLPAVLAKGFTITFTDPNGVVSHKKSSKSLTFSRSASKNLGSFCFLKYLKFKGEDNNSSVYYSKAKPTYVKSKLMYSTDGFSWVTWTNGPSKKVDISNGKCVFIKGDNPGGLSNSDSSYVNFNIEGKVAASGNVMSLIYNDNFESNVTIPNDYCFSCLFRDCKTLTTMPDLPATTLTSNCYYRMFRNCSGLTTAKNLPATTLAEGCYLEMFSLCTSLANVPAQLPATTLEKNCYRNMYNGCTSLTQAPLLPATSLAEGSYQSMFAGCSSLSYIEIGLTEWIVKNSSNWVSGVSASGTFVCPKNIKNNGNITNLQSENRIPVGWTIVEK